MPYGGANQAYGYASDEFQYTTGANEKSISMSIGGHKIGAMYYRVYRSTTFNNFTNAYYFETPHINFIDYGHTALQTTGDVFINNYPYANTVNLLNQGSGNYLAYTTITGQTGGLKIHLKSPVISSISSGTGWTLSTNTDYWYKVEAVDVHGVRTFATVYSKNESLEIGNNLIPTIDLYNKRKDQLKSLIDTKCISGKLYRKLMNKYGSNMRNKIDDLHKKVSVMLVKKFKTINIGKISTKSIVSNETSNLSDLNKRRLLTLSFYRFLERLKFFGKKYDSKINLLSEYKTSMSCNNCGNEDKNLGNSKIYNCSKCRLVIDRDINSAMIFYRGGYDCLN